MTTSKKSLQWLHLIAFALILGGAKLALVHFYGNITPYWDQWDAEADTLYRAFFDGTLSWNGLIEPLNEHRVLITRLWNLTLISVNGVWNPLLQMTVNAFLHVLVLGYFVVLLARVLGEKWLPALLIFTAILFSIPFAWENTLAGIQSMFYFVLFFSFSSLWLLLSAPAFGIRWLLGLLCAVLAFLSLASGIFAPLAVAVCGVIFYTLRIRRSREHLLGIFLLGLLCFVGFALTPTLAHHAPLKASSLSQYLEALKSTLSWPEGAGFIALGFRNFPAILFTVQMLKIRPQAQDKRWYLFVVLLWLGLTCGALAYGRATGSTAPRYLDLIAMFLLVNFACIISNYESGFFKSRSRAKWASAVWVTAIGASLFVNSYEKIPAELATKHATSVQQELNTKNFLATGEKSYLENKPFLDIPYPSAERLIGLLTDPKIVSFLPPALLPSEPAPKLGRFDEGVKTLVSNYLWFIIAGLVVSFGIAISIFRRKTVNATYTSP